MLKTKVKVKKKRKVKTIVEATRFPFLVGCTPKSTAFHPHRVKLRKTTTLPRFEPGISVSQSRQANH